MCLLKQLGQIFVINTLPPSKLPVTNFQVCIMLLTYLLLSFDAGPSRQIPCCSSEGFTNKTCHQPVLLMRCTWTFSEHACPLGCTQCRDHRHCHLPLYSRTQWSENALSYGLACFISLTSHLRRVTCWEQQWSFRSKSGSKICLWKPGTSEIKLQGASLQQRKTVFTGRQGLYSARIKLRLEKEKKKKATPIRKSTANSKIRCKTL